MVGDQPRLEPDPDAVQVGGHVHEPADGVGSTE
jgi:hypothetical protein